MIVLEYFSTEVHSLQFQSIVAMAPADCRLYSAVLHAPIVSSHLTIV